MRVPITVLLGETRSQGSEGPRNLDYNDAPAILQVSISAEAEVSVQGRATPDAPWVELSERISKSGVYILTTLLPQMRVQWQGNTGTLSLWAVL